MANNNPSHHAQPGERGQGGSQAGAVSSPAPRGGGGGQSGTGQATPHHGLQQPGGDAALNPPVGGREPALDGSPDYQSGGTQQDRAQKDEERKADENTNPSPTSGGADPAPGSQGGQNP